MINDMIAAISKIADRINESKSTEEAFNSIKNEKNYDKKTWAAAYSWIFDKYMRNRKSWEVNFDLLTASGFRFLTESEKDFIGLDNFNYLLNFYNAQILDKQDLEKIITMLKTLPHERVNRESINAFIFALFYNVEEESLPGSRRLLHTSDTIN